MASISFKSWHRVRRTWCAGVVPRCRVSCSWGYACGVVAEVSPIVDSWQRNVNCSTVNVPAPTPITPPRSSSTFTASMSSSLRRLHVIASSRAADAFAHRTCPRASKVPKLAPVKQTRCLSSSPVVFSGHSYVWTYNLRSADLHRKICTSLTLLQKMGNHQARQRQKRRSQIQATRPPHKRHYQCRQDERTRPQHEPSPRPRHLHRKEEPSPKGLYGSRHCARARPVCYWCRT